MTKRQPLTPLTPDQIERLAQRQADAIQAPQRTVGSVLVALLVAGVGGLAVAGVLFGILSGLGAPSDILLIWSGRAALLGACLYLAAWALPTGKAQSLRWYAEAQEAVKLAEFRKTEAYRELIAMRTAKDAGIRELEAAKDERIKELEAALGEVRSTNKVLRSEKKIITERAQNPRWTPRSNVSAETRRNAETILQHWFATIQPDSKGKPRGEWWSRPKATAAGWTKAQHEEAAQLLEDAALTGQNGLLPFVLPDVRDLTDALHRLDAYCNEAEQEPVMPVYGANYVESFDA